METDGTWKAAAAQRLSKHRMSAGGTEALQKRIVLLLVNEKRQHTEGSFAARSSRARSCRGPGLGGSGPSSACAAKHQQTGSTVGHEEIYMKRGRLRQTWLTQAKTSTSSRRLAVNCTAPSELPSNAPSNFKQEAAWYAGAAAHRKQTHPAIAAADTAPAFSAALGFRDRRRAQVRPEALL